jgi:thiol-disulfide isomerase/thioredoxin
MQVGFPKILGLLVVVLLAYGIGRYLYFKPKFINGEAAPNFTAQNINGQVFELANLAGNYVLVDFWGSWCAPCRKENPALVEFYKKYKDAQFQDAKGFEVVSIGVERSEKSWKNAIQRDGLAWEYHIMDENKDMRFFDAKIAGMFGIKEVPTKYLLNQKGEIIGVNLSFEDMSRLLDSRI